MLLIKNRKGQSMLEYALLLGVVIAGILIMQVFVKRSFQGGLKDAGDKIGDQFSAGGTTISRERTMSTNQDIIEEVATTDAGNGISSFVTGLGETVEGTIGGSKEAYSLNKRLGGDASTETKQKTDAATQEKVRWADYQSNVFTEFTDPF